MYPIIIKPQNGLPIYYWTDPNQVEAAAKQQALNLAKLPFAFHHIAIMPDIHVGYGMPIGGILATKDMVLPNAVGVDIGCGMRAVQTNLTYKEIEPHLDNILHMILSQIPTGFNWHKTNQSDPIFNNPPSSPVIEQQLNRARKQLGTLGGGNHFIDILREENPDNKIAVPDQLIWILIHSGSRNIGKQIADYYYRQAKQNLDRTKYPNYPSIELAYLEFKSDLGQAYWQDMSYAMDFARTNREHMMIRTQKIISHIFPKAEYIQEIDIHHNYASLENHFGQEVIVHRKGATLATKNTVGIIPGSMGSPSYIVRGLGNADSFNSCSHGAGRTMSRSQAKKQFSPDQILKDLEEVGIKIAKHKLSNIAEEARFVYKNIDDIIKKQKDLVVVLHRLIPLGVVQG